MKVADLSPIPTALPRTCHLVGGRVGGHAQRREGGCVLAPDATQASSRLSLEGRLPAERTIYQERQLEVKGTQKTLLPRIPSGHESALPGL